MQFQLVCLTDRSRALKAVQAGGEIKSNLQQWIRIIKIVAGWDDDGSTVSHLK